MQFGLYADGRVMPRFDYEERPMIGDVPAELSEAKSDLARAPRPEALGAGVAGGVLSGRLQSQKPATLPCRSY